MPLDIPGIINSELEARNAEISAINRQIHSDPELAYEEFHAHDNLVHLLSARRQVMRWVSTSLRIQDGED
ncbi:uncharacterized protein B0T15DRAFT_537305 [Chaetomium strumarium]|uniref:Uncharacterized protein n=1 Tax=Chaetomium strumarium TaxID=1170767 RepID=A0AAJ0GRP4_9PEZI|nr:hypothetical protein B0T15DRAFT_537305 [Chaetomium strumarium]